MRMPSGNSKDGNVADQGSQGFVFKPLGVKTVSRNNISPLANLVLLVPYHGHGHGREVSWFSFCSAGT